MPRPPFQHNPYPTRAQTRQDIIDYGGGGGGEPPSVPTPTGVSVTIESMVPGGTLVDVIGTQTFDGTPTVNVGAAPAGCSAVAEGPKSIRIRVPHVLSGTTVQFPYTITDNGGTSSVIFITATIRNDALVKPMIFMDQTEDVAMINSAIANGWDWGMSSYAWDTLAWIEACAGAGRMMKLPFVLWVDNGGGSYFNDMLVEPNAWGGTPAWKPRGQAAYNLLANNPQVHDFIGVMNLEFESTNANTNHPGGNEQYVRDNADFFLSQMDAIGLEDRCYIYRSQHLSGNAPGFSGNVKFKRWSRPNYLYGENSSAPSETSVRFDFSSLAWRNLAANKGLAEVENIGVFLTATGQSINPRQAWPYTPQRINPGYNHFLSWMQCAERAGCDWISYWLYRWDEGGTVYAHEQENWDGLLRAIDDFLRDDVSINSDLTNATAPVGAFE